MENNKLYVKARKGRSIIRKWMTIDELNELVYNGWSFNIITKPQDQGKVEELHWWDKFKKWFRRNVW